jgi:2-polyprenyl-3-methyl-5-hydroxy-6-metoxy-1,4-benzoquinol methylase
MKLPLEYSELSGYFDALGNGSPETVNRSIGKILKKYKVKSVLDLSCGTGSQVLWLAKQGYNVTGVDLSPNLLKIAKNKVRQEKTKVRLLAGDMRSTLVGQFDAVITIFNAVGHVTKIGFEKTMRNINKNLQPGGIYIFDIFNLSSLTKKVLAGMKLDMTKTVGKTTIHHTQYSEFDRQKRRLVSYDRFSLQENANKPKILKAKFALQIYTAKELRTMLAKNGFSVLGQYAMDGSKFSEKTTKDMLTVAKKL